MISRAFVFSPLLLLLGFISVSFLISPQAPILWRFISFPFHPPVFEPPHRIWTLPVLLCFSFKAPLVEACFVYRFFLLIRWCWNKWSRVCRRQPSPVQQINCEQSISSPIGEWVSAWQVSLPRPRSPSPRVSLPHRVSFHLHSPARASHPSWRLQTLTASPTWEGRARLGPSGLPSLIKATNSLSRYLGTSNNKTSSSQ